MSPQQPNRNDYLGHFAGIILVLTFAAIFFILSANSRGLSFSPETPDDARTVAEIVPTETPQPPTATSTPTTAPTDTPTPTDTPQPTSTPTTVPTDPPPPTDNEIDSASADAYDPELIARGEQQYLPCAACHSMDARGVPNLGKDLVDSEFMRTHSDDEVMQMIITGRPIWDPDNTTGIDMPSRGGNPALTNDDILAIIAYLRSLDDGE
jgi:mono/diheme cytochrome c family protein